MATHGLSDNKSSITGFENAIVFRGSQELEF